MSKRKRCFFNAKLFTAVDVLDLGPHHRGVGTEADEHVVGHTTKGPHAGDPDPGQSVFHFFSE